MVTATLIIVPAEFRWTNGMADQDRDLSETKRIMACFVNAPHKPQAELKVGKPKAAKLKKAKPAK